MHQYQNHKLQINNLILKKKKKKGLEFRMLYNGSLSGTHAARSGEQ